MCDYCPAEIASQNLIEHLQFACRGLTQCSDCKETYRVHDMILHGNDIFHNFICSACAFLEID